MSHSNNPTRAGRAGFSLAEMLVAMAIFIVLLGGLASLFAGAISSVRQGKITTEGFAIGRGALAALEADLKGAFTAKEFGDVYKFHGSPLGFMFVGSLPSGKLGRVTYVIRPNLNRGQFRGELTLNWGFLREGAAMQATRAALDAGFDPADTVTLRNFENAARGVIDAAFGNNPLSPFPENQQMVLDVVFTTMSLLRFEENRTDLDSFELPTGMQWPIINPDPPPSVSPAAWDSYDTGVERTANETLYQQVLLGINPDAFDLDYSRDIRALVRDYEAGMASGVVVPALNGIGADTIEQLVAARKRDVWIRMLAGDASLGLPDFWAGTGRDPADYAIADQLLAIANVLHPGSGDYIALPVAGGRSVLFNALNIEAFFFYGTLDNVDAISFNDNQNIIPLQVNEQYTAIGYPEFIRDPSLRMLQAFDQTVTALRGGRLQDAHSKGTSLTPRIPEMLEPRIWITIERPVTGGADFRRLFSQAIEIPTGAQRERIPVHMVPKRNQS